MNYNITQTLNSFCKLHSKHHPCVASSCFLLTSSRASFFALILYTTMEVDNKTPKKLLKKGKISCNAHNKAMEFAIFSKCGSFHIRNFWITTISFWICFFVWFGNTNLIVWISRDIGLSDTEKSYGKICLSLSTVFFRIIIGDLLDKLGSRYCYILVAILSLIPVCLLSFCNSAIMYIILNFFIGIVGASFVVTQYHTTQFFVDRLIGLANATSAGWGNWGGGCAAIFMPFLATELETSFGSSYWRAITFGSGLLLLLPIILYYYFGVDTVDGNLDYKKMFTKEKLFNMTQFKITCQDYRTWILFVVYMICFGVEITVLSFLANYLRDHFELDPTTAGLFVFMFSCLNLFARSIGGYGSDILYRKYGIQGRVYTLFLVLIAESIFLFIFSFGDFNLGYSIVILLFFSFYVQCAEGITYAIVPFIKLGKSKGMGPMYGIVAAGGNFGSFLFSITIFLFTPNGRSKINYQTGFIILSIFIFIGSFLCLKIKFTQKEIRDADELLMSFLKVHHQNIYGNDQNNNNEQEHKDMVNKSDQNKSKKEGQEQDQQQSVQDIKPKHGVQIVGLSGSHKHNRESIASLTHEENGNENEQVNENNKIEIMAMNIGIPDINDNIPNNYNNNDTTPNMEDDNAPNITPAIGGNANGTTSKMTFVLH